MQGLGWELGQLNIIGQIPEKDPLRTINYEIDPRALFFAEYGKDFPVRGLALGQVIGVLIGRIFGAKKSSTWSL
jgi:hypothetical protein